MPVQTRSRDTQPTKTDKGNVNDSSVPPPTTSSFNSTGAPTTVDQISEDILFNASSSRANATHIFFWGGVLSNWCATTKFSGARCFELLIPELTKRGIAHPSLDAFASRLLMGHMFNCGEQFMMAMKGWFSETDLLLLAGEAVGADRKSEVQELMAGMYEAKAPKAWIAGSKEREMWDGTVCKVLRAKNPRQQKALGRRARGFDVQVWSAVSMLCVTAACVARAEADVVLKSMYVDAGKRKFVEGSPTDTVWGVGIHWKESAIEDPALWIGENRLGMCHDEAARKIREM